MRQYKNEYGTVFAVREKDGEPRLMCLSEDGLGNSRWAVSGVLAARTGDAKTEEELQAVLDRTAEELGWTEYKDADAPTGAAAATTGGAAASAESTAETSTTSESGEDANNSPGLPSAPADTSPQPPKAADAVPATRTTASAASGNGSLPAFDYSGLDDQTVQDLHLAEREFAGGKRMAEIGLRRMADGVTIAHEALCGSCDNLSQLKHGNRGDDTFGRWCESVGLNRKAAERLLQVSKLFDSSGPRQQQVLEELSPSLLYAAAKPSAPAELVQAVKDGDITSHKQYQDLLTRYNAEHAAREQAEQERDEAATHIQAARDMQIDTARERDAALRRAEQAEAERNAARQEASAASARAAKAEKAREEAEHIAEISRKRADRWQATAEAAQNQPVAAVVDEDEVNRRAHKLADELTAPLREELESARAAVADPDQAELDARNAYDSIILASRTISNAWQSVKQQLAKIPPNQRSGAIDAFNKVLASIRSEAISCL